MSSITASVLIFNKCQQLRRIETFTAGAGEMWKLLAFKQNRLLPLIRRISITKTNNTNYYYRTLEPIFFSKKFVFYSKYIHVAAIDVLQVTSARAPISTQFLLTNVTDS